MRATERRIFHFDMEVKRRGHTTNLPPLTKLLEAWKEKSEAKEAFQVRATGDVVFGITQVKYFDNDQACILVYVTDRNSSDAVYGDLKTGKADRKSKGPTEGGMHSAHVVVSTKPYKADTYYCIIEQANKLNQSNIELMLNSVLHDVYTEDKTRFTYDDPSGRRTRDKQIKKIPFLPRVELKAYPSEELLRSLQTQRITNITLSVTNEKSDFGDHPYLVETRRQMTVKVKPNFPQGDRLDGILAAIRKGSKGYEQVRITFDGLNGEPQKVDFNVSNGTVIDSRNVKNELLGNIAPPLADACEEIVSRLVQPMLAKLKEKQGG